MISTSATRMPALMPSQPWSLYTELFTLDPIRMLQRMSEGQHGASQSPNLEEFLLSVTGPVVDNLHFVGLSQSYSYLKFVPLGQW